MPLGDPYATVSELRRRFGLDDLDDDDLLTEALEAATSAVEGFCRRQFNDAESASSRVYTAQSRSVTKPDDFHTDAGLVVETDDDCDGTFETTWTAAEFQLEPVNGVVDGQDGWPYWRVRAVGDRAFPVSRRATIRITAQWGWEAVPSPVKDVTLQLAQELTKLKDAPFGVAGFSEFGAVRVRENPKFRKMLTPYRRGNVLVA